LPRIEEPPLLQLKPAHDYDVAFLFPGPPQSLGVASHTNSAMGGERRFNSIKATPAFFSELM
jgi:hypothetical protein